MLAQQLPNSSLEAIYNSYQNNRKPTLVNTKSYQNSFYKKYISKQISANCQFNSTCSEFMSEAINKKGFKLGFLLGLDRYSRCGASENTYNYLPSLQWKYGTTLIDDLHIYE